MKIRIALSSKIVLVLLLSGIVMQILSAFFFGRLDSVVHGDLYRYGLQFDYEWAGQYWTYSRLMMNFLALAVVVTGISAIFILVHAQTRYTSSRFISCLLLMVGIVMTGFSAFFLNRLDYIVHNDLYRYGLQFNYEWAGQYWTYVRLMLGLLVVAIATDAISIVLFLGGDRTGEIKRLLSTRSLHKINSTKLICFILFSVGVIALAISINYTSSILALIGLGLIFWGSLLFYVRPEKYAKETLLNKTALSSLESLEQIIKELGYKGKGVYLPPKYFKDLGSVRLYISAREDIKLPTPEQIQQEEDKVFLKNPEGILITPPGAGLTELFEETLGTDFTRVDLYHIEQNMPRLLTEDLEIAQNIEIITENNKVHVKIENSVYKNMCKEAKSLPNIHGSVGCSLCSAIACALAKATGTPIIIEKDHTSDDYQTVKIEYRLLDIPEEKTQ